jgi:hypothetical protein
MAQANTTPATEVAPVPLTINSWGEVKQQLMFQGREIVNASKRVQPGTKSQVIFYTTKDGVEKRFYFADEVAILDTASMREKEVAINDIYKRFKRHEISAADMAVAIAALES